MPTLIVLLSFIILTGIIVAIEALPAPAAVAIGIAVAVILTAVERHMAGRAR